MIGLTLPLLNSVLVAMTLLLSPGADAGHPPPALGDSNVSVMRTRPAIAMAPVQQTSAITPSLTVTNTTNGVYAPVSPGPMLTVGSPVTWTYLISNTGSVSVTIDAVVDDPQGPLVADDCTPNIGATVAPGGQMVCIVDTENVTTGQYSNLVTVTGTNFSNPGLSTVVTDVSHYFGVATGIALTKYTNGLDVATPTGLYLRVGAPVTWTYRITNTGNVTLTLVLTDVGTIGGVRAVAHCAHALAGGLAPNANTLCTLTGTVQTGAYANIATVTGTATVGDAQVTASDSSYYFGVTTGIRLTKYTNGQVVATPTSLYLRVGDLVTWTYRITNTGNVTLTLALTDVSTSGVRGVSGCAPGGLAPNANTLCTLTGAVQENQYSNTATVTGTTTVGAGWQAIAADSSYYYGIRPQVAISKTTNGAGSTQPPGLYVAFGDSVTWVYTLQNTGNVTLTTLSLTDDPEGPVANCTPFALVNGLAPAQFTVCTLSGRAARAGQYTNTATITGTSALVGFTPITITDSVKSFYFGVTAGISLTKYTNGQVVASPTSLYLRVGDPVTWTYRITNTSNVPLTNLTLTDDRLGAVTTCAPALSGGLAPAASTLCTVNGVVQAGQYTNTATVTGATALGTPRPVDASASSYYYGVTPGLALTKYTNGVEVAAAPGLYLTAGDTVVWTYRITNTGNAALANLVLTDDRVGAITGCTPALASGLAAGASTLCTASGTVQAGQYANTATVTGATASGVPQVASDSSYYFGVTKGIALTKRTNDQDVAAPPGPSVDAGAAVAWTYHITNTSNVALTGLTLTDDQLGAVATCTPALSDGLAPNGSTLCTANGVARAGQYANTATVTGTTAAGTPQSVVASDASYYFGVTRGITLTKYTNGALALTPPGPYLTVGASVVWTYRITNTGNVALTSLALSDDPQGDIATCTPALGDGLAPAASTLCTANGVAQAGQYANTATVTGTTNGGMPQSVVASDTSHYTGVASEGSLTKQVAPTNADAGEVVTYTLVVTGSAATQPVTLAITDTLPAALVLEAGSVSATLGVPTLDPATNTLHWIYTTTPGRADTATITYSARLSTQCPTALTNQARLFIDGAEAGQAAATVALKSAPECDVFLPVVVKPAEQLPSLVNGYLDAPPEGMGWSQTIVTIQDTAGDLIYADGAPFTALSKPNYAWLGGARNQTNQLRQSLTTALPASYAATLQFCYRLESNEPAPGNDYVEIRAGEKTTPDAADNRQRIDLYAGTVTWGQQWKRAAVSLDALKGKTVTVEFFSSLNGALNSNFLVDNVKLCVAAAVPGSNAPVCATEEFCSAATAATEAGNLIVEKP